MVNWGILSVYIYIQYELERGFFLVANHIFLPPPTSFKTGCSLTYIHYVDIDIKYTRNAIFMILDILVELLSYMISNWVILKYQF